MQLRPYLTEAQRREMARDCKFGGVPLYQQGFWNVLMRVISNEAYQLGVNAGGYNTTLDQLERGRCNPVVSLRLRREPEVQGVPQGIAGGAEVRRGAVSRTPAA